MINRCVRQKTLQHSSPYLELSSIIYQEIFSSSGRQFNGGWPLLRDQLLLQRRQRLLNLPLRQRQKERRRPQRRREILPSSPSGKCLQVGWLLTCRFPSRKSTVVLIWNIYLTPPPPSPLCTHPIVVPLNRQWLWEKWSLMHLQPLPPLFLPHRHWLGKSRMSMIDVSDAWIHRRTLPHESTIQWWKATTIR